MKMRNAIVLSLVLLFAVPSVAHAYLDPGTGSQVFQILIAVFVGAGFTLKVYWRRIKAFFRPESESSDE